MVKPNRHFNPWFSWAFQWLLSSLVTLFSFRIMCNSQKIPSKKKKHTTSTITHVITTLRSLLTAQSPDLGSKFIKLTLNSFPMPDLGTPGGASSKEPACQGRRCKRHGFDPWIWKIPWSKQWQLAPVFLCLEDSMDREQMDYSPWGCKESDTTEHIAQCQT